jgi:hypothetical protein
LRLKDFNNKQKRRRSTCCPGCLRVLGLGFEALFLLVMLCLALYCRREEVLDDAEQRYARVRTSAQNFLIMQFGLATFQWSTLTGCYEAQTYNFYIFPRPSGGMDYRFTCQASSLDFLREHGFDFNKFIYSGEAPKFWLVSF